MIDRSPEFEEEERARAMVARFLALAGITDPDLAADAEDLLYGQIAQISREGLREPDLAVMGQAYIRAVGRVVAAETEAILRVRALRQGDEASLLATVERLLPLGRDVFDSLHRLLLRRAIGQGGDGVDRSHRSQRPAAVAHVDVIGSTALLQQATILDTQRMVDGLFAAAQVAVRDRPVEVIKYVGDGVFLAGGDPAAVAAASLDCIHALARDSGLPARAGLAYGRVIHRAGDVFGLAVNLSHALTKLAAPGALLATAVAPAQLPAAMCRQPRQVTVHGIDGPLGAFEMAAG